MTYTYTYKILEEFNNPIYNNFIIKTILLMHPDTNILLFVHINKDREIVSIYEELKGLLMHDFWNDRKEDYSRDFFTLEQFNSEYFWEWVQETYFN